MDLVLYPSPHPPSSEHGLVQTRRPGVSALLGLFWNHQFCGPSPKETVFGSVVRVAVVVWL